MTSRTCWCGSDVLLPFSVEYQRCGECGTLISQVGLSDSELKVVDDSVDFYGKQYWLNHQSNDLNFPNIYQRARNDLIERNLHWLRTLTKYCTPPAKILEIGCSHGSFVALLRQAGYDAMGMEMSPWVVQMAKETFDIPMAVGPLETVELPKASFDVIALMDVLEHLPSPIETMRHALDLLKPGGSLLIQTPQFKEEMDYDKLVATNAAFLEQLKSDEHLYLFTKDSANRLFRQIGATDMLFEPPIFDRYDMFFLVSRQPIRRLPDEEVAKSLETPKGRFVQALIDQDNYIKRLEAEIVTINADREARLQQIHTLTAMVQSLQ